MTVAARLLDARQGFIYLRGEYRYLLEPLQAVLERRRAAGLLGTRILGSEGFDFDITIHLGAGAYVCGEESSLIESLEGKRGTPRIRPPFPVERGYLGAPTIVNNVETFCAAAHIAQQRRRLVGRGRHRRRAAAPSCTRSAATASGPASTNTRSASRSSRSCTTAAPSRRGAARRRCRSAGRRGCAWRRTSSAAASASRTCPPPAPSWSSTSTRDMFETARSFAHFFAHESCGFCTPCRVGTELVVRRMDKLAAGHGSLFDEAELRELEALLHGTTHCGLGASATNPLRDTLLRFRPRLRAAPAVADLHARLRPRCRTRTGAPRHRPRRCRCPSGARRMNALHARRRRGAFRGRRHADGRSATRRPLRAAPVLAPGAGPERRLPAVHGQGRGPARRRLHHARGARPGGREPHARPRRQAPHAAADAVRRRQPLLPRLREERRLPAAGHRLRDGHDRPAVRGVLSDTRRSMPATTSSGST